jgi:predicted ribosome quality control (RQC) complex YloA/Tae2 family protein
MTKITLNLDKTIEENASVYFEKAKKAKKKIEGATEAIIKSKQKLKKIIKNNEKNKITKTIVVNRKKEWFEKFHWFYSSEGFLVIGGRDATTNEIVIKKYTEENDIVFHTDMAGSPFFVIKTEKKTPTEISLKETADATASYSRGWKKNLATQNVFYIKSDQVTKKAKAGESLGKGAFMISGKTTYINNKMRIAIGCKDNQIIGGPVNAIKKQSEKFIEIIQGDNKSSDIAKQIRKFFGFGDLDEIIRFLPSGGLQIKK